MPSKTASQPSEDHPLPLLSQPLTLVRGAVQPSSSFWEIDERRRKNLAQKKHFLVRGTEWLDFAGIRATDLRRSGYLIGIFENMRKFGAHWEKFCEEWNYDRADGGNLGKNIVAEYIYNNHPDRFLEIINVESRYLTLYRAVGLIAFFHLFANGWFGDAAKGKGRRSIFTERAGVDYYDGYIFDHMFIEPIVYKIANLGSATNEALMGVDWQYQPDYDLMELAPSEEFLAEFRNNIDLPWIRGDLDASAVVIGLFVQERCSDLVFIDRVAKFTGQFFNVAPPSIRSGSNFKGPLNGVLYQRFIDIRKTT